MAHHRRPAYPCWPDIATDTCHEPVSRRCPHRRATRAAAADTVGYLSRLLWLSRPVLRPSTGWSARYGWPVATADAHEGTGMSGQPNLTPHSVPADWAGSWGDPSPFLRPQLQDLLSRSTALARDVPSLPKQVELGPLVGSAEIREHPVHRWYHYKEAFSPRLPLVVRRDLGITDPIGADVFGGVATTALSLQGRSGTDKIVSVEYSPFAQFAGATKLSWPWLEPTRLRTHSRTLLDYPLDISLPVPSLSTFGNREIFDETTLASLVSAREAIRSADLWERERDFFLLGLAAIVETASGAMKDGRALRIRRERRRSYTSLTPRESLDSTGDTVRDLLSQQWAAMIEDLEQLKPYRAQAKRNEALHLRGDARELGLVKRSPRRSAFEEGSVGWSCFSPPYLNCIDYSEVYKLELWLLEFVRTQQEFRSLRLGTLRSHPSVDFPARGYLAGVQGNAVELIAELVSFMERHGVRPSEARMVTHYFDDMYRVFSQQMWALKPGGAFACVVGNSTFSRRLKRRSGSEEMWRVPILTDVLLAHLAKTAGFVDVHIWTARTLRPRNVRGGSARESVVVGRKPRQ